jgi:hypothetical protein
LTDVDRLIQSRLAGLDKFVRHRLPQSRGATITVAPSADDSAEIDQALARARAQHVQGGGAVTILFRPGVYHLSRPLRLTAADSGGPNAPLRLQGDPSGPVILTGTTALARVPLPAEFAKLVPPGLGGRTLSFAIPAGVAPEPAFPARASVIDTTHPTLIVTQGNQWFRRSAWPAQGYELQAIAQPQPGPAIAPVVTLPPEVSRRLAGEPALSAAGYWTFDWFYEERPVAGISSGELHVGALTSHYPEAKNIRFRLLNGFGLLAAPGDMAYVNGHLVAIPYNAGEPVEAAQLETVLEVDGAHDVVLDGLAVRGARGMALTVQRSHDVVFANGYVGMTGAGGITVSDSRRVVIDHSVVADVGETGVALLGQDDELPTHNAVINSVITATGQLTRAYAPAIRLTGAGQVVRGNLLTGLPHAAIIFNGRDHAIVSNEIARTTLETGDAGAVYSFCNFTTRGSVIAYNYFHDIVKASGLNDAPSNLVRTVYLDDWTSGVTVAGNLFNRASWPFWINGGEMNRIARNVFVDAGRSPGQIYDISGHWRKSSGNLVRRSLAKLDRRKVQEFGIRLNSSLLTNGRGSGNTVEGNVSFGSGITIVASSLASSQSIQPERVLQSPRRAVDLSQALTLARDAGLDLTGRIGNRAMELSSLRYATLVEQRPKP